MSQKIKTIEEHIKYLSSTISDIDKVLLEKDLPFLKVNTQPVSGDGKMKQWTSSEPLHQLFWK